MKIFSLFRYRYKELFHFGCIKLVAFSCMVKYIWKLESVFSYEMLSAYVYLNDIDKRIQYSDRVKEKKNNKKTVKSKLNRKCIGRENRYDKNKM